MGSWNKTCGLTNLHTCAGTPVYVFPLEKSNMHDRCYATAFWKPVLLPFEAEYNDYGSGEECEEFVLNYILNELRRQIVEMDVGENQYHDIAVKRDKLDEELFFRAVREGRLKVKDIFGSEAEVDFVMMRKDAVDAVLAEWKLDIYQGRGENGEGEYDVFGYADVVKEVPGFIQELDETPDKELLLMSGIRPSSKRLRTVLQGDDYRYSSILRITSLLIEEVENGNLFNADRLLTTYIKGKMIDMFFEETRRLWQPGCHEGSQSQDVDAYKILLNVTSQAIEREEKEMDEW